MHGRVSCCACGPPARASDKITSLRSCRAPERAFESWLPPARLLDLGPRLDNQNPRAIAMSFVDVLRTHGRYIKAGRFNRKYYVVPTVGTHQNFSAPKCHKPKKHCQTDQGRWPPPRPHFWVFCRPALLHVPLLPAPTRPLRWAVLHFASSLCVD